MRETCCYPDCNEPAVEFHDVTNENARQHFVKNTRFKVVDGKRLYFCAEHWDEYASMEKEWIE